MSGYSNQELPDIADKNIMTYRPMPRNKTLSALDKAAAFTLRWAGISLALWAAFAILWLNFGIGLLAASILFALTIGLAVIHLLSSFSFAVILLSIAALRQLHGGLCLLRELKDPSKTAN